MDKQILYRATPLKKWQEKNPGRDWQHSHVLVLESGLHVLEPITLPTEEEIQKILYTSCKKTEGEEGITIIATFKDQAKAILERITGKL